MTQSAADQPAQKLFDDNASTYDRVNTIISLGLDARWRDWVARQAATRPGARVLDAFAGTGLVGLRAASRGARVMLADISPGMLAVATHRASKRKLHVSCVTTDLTTDSVSVPGAPFDAITMVFGVRYLDDPSAVIRNLSGLLAEDGRFVVMEFVDPEGGFLSRIASFYFFRVLPRIAGALAGRRELYQRLTSTTRAIRGRESLERIVSDAGLTIAETRVMGFGLVVGIVATPDPDRR